MTDFGFNPVTGLSDTNTFPQKPGATAARQQFMVLFNQLRDFINSTLMNGNGTITADNAAAGSLLASGWIDPKETWTYVVSNQVTVPSGATLKYRIGDPIMFTQNGTVNYGNVAAVTDTSLMIIPNSDFAIVNAPITNNYYSHQPTPFGFPQWFNYAPTVTWTNGPTSPTDVKRFSIVGRTCTVRFHRHGTANASTSAMLKITLPFPPASNYSGSTQYPVGSGTCTDNVSFIYSCATYLLSSDSTITMEWTPGKPINGNILAIYEI